MNVDLARIARITPLTTGYWTTASAPSTTAGRDSFPPDKADTGCSATGTACRTI